MFFYFFFFNDTANTEIYTVSDTLSLHDALPISPDGPRRTAPRSCSGCSRRTGRSEEHTSELPSPDTISYAVFCLKKKKKLQLIFLFSVFTIKKVSVRESIYS